MTLSLMVATLALVLATPVAQAGYGAGNARLENLYSSFMSPCCWRENLTVHESPAASQLRSRIQGMVTDGQSDAAIKGALVAEFGKRILALPEGATRLWLFWTPMVSLGLGLLALLLFLKRMRRPTVATALDAAHVAELDAAWDRD